jgi:HlyD family secretion protein
MSKRGAIIAVVFCLVGIGAAIAVTAPDKIDLFRGTTGANAQANPQGNDKPAEKRWLAVAPGRVEPPSGMIKVAAPTMGVVSKVLVKVNDTVFAGEPLILLNDEEIQSRYLAAESQAGMRKRLRDEQTATGKAAERRRAEDAVADAETAVFDAQMVVDKAAIAWRAGSGSNDNLTNARSALARAQDELGKRQAQHRAGGADARVNLEKLRIRAPIDGTVLQLNINPGELATPSSISPLLLIANLTTLNVRAELDERDVSGIKIGQPAAIRAAAFPGKEFTGAVSSIAPLVEPSRLGARAQQGNRSDVDSVEVLVRLSQPGPLTAGMKVDVYFSQEKTAGR